MMKKTFTTAALFFTIALATARAQVVYKGDNIVSAGFGLGSSLAVGATSKTPLISLQYERAILDVSRSGTISLGGYVGYHNYALGEDQFSYTVVGIRSAFHLNGIDIGNTDLYGGMMVSYDFRGSPSKSFHTRYLGISGADIYHSKFDFMPYIGARLFITDHLAALVEVSYGASFLNLGMAWKL